MPFCLHVDAQQNDLSLHFESSLDYKTNEKTRRFYDDRNFDLEQKNEIYDNFKLQQ